MTRRVPQAAALLVVTAALALVALLAPGAAATLTPPPTGDWTIDVGEDAVLSSGTTTVTGNITVRGTLTVRNATLVVAAPSPAVVPRLFVEGPAAFALDNATLRSGAPGSSNMTLDASAGASIVLRSSLVQGLASTTQGNLALVGAHFVSTTVDATDTVVDASGGGLGLDLGSTLTARNLSVSVQNRSLYLTGASTATVDGFTAWGTPSGSEFLVLLNGSTMTGSNIELHNATNLMLLLSSTASFADAAFENATHSALLLVGSTLSINGAFVAPRAFDSLGVEAYGSTFVASNARFQNYTFGIAALGSAIDVVDAEFVTSNTTPKSAFAAVYAFDSSVNVTRVWFNGSYFVSDVAMTDENGSIIYNQTTGLPELRPVFNCANSALWLVRSRVTGGVLTTFCFSDHLHMEDSDVRLIDTDSRDGNSGLTMQGGSIDAWNVTLTNLSRGGGATGARFLRTTGTIQGMTSRNNSIGAEFTDSSVRLVGLDVRSPGLGVSVRSGNPVIEGAVFHVHNETAVLVQAGSPTVLNNSFWLTADRTETYGVEVTGGEPMIEGNDFHGTFLLTYGVAVHFGPAHLVGNWFEHLDRGAQFYSRGFEAVNNTFTECYNGADASAGSTGTIAGNLFFNMTAFTAGNSVNVYFSAATVSGNTFQNVNYGVKVFSTNATLKAGPRISGNNFQDVAFYAIEIINTTLPVLVDNNTARNATRGGIELLFSNATSAYNVIYDGENYGYEITDSNLTIVGGRLENLREGIHAVNSRVEISYTTFLLNHAGMTAQDTPVIISNSSFQFNGIAAQFITNRTVYVNDSIFVGNVEALLVYNATDLKVRDTNFIGTLDYIVRNDQASTGSIEFTRRGELNGGRFLLRGTLTSTADALILRSVKMVFASPIGTLPGVSIQGAESLTMVGVSLANNSVPFFFEIVGSAGNLSQVAVRAAWPTLARPGMGPYFGASQLNLRDFAVNESMENFTVEGSQLFASNFSSKDNRGAGIVLRGSGLAGAVVTVLDNGRCGVVASGGSLLNATNLTVRGNGGGSLCFNASRADVLDGDFSSMPVDVLLDGGSEAHLVSTTTVRGWVVNDTSLLSISWRMSITVTYPNAALLPQVSISFIDAKGHAVLANPAENGRVQAIWALPERFVTFTTNDVRTPYAVLASFENANASASVVLTQDRLVELDLADRLLPTVAIGAPSEGAGFANSSVTLRFNASDTGSGLSSLQFRFGAGAFTAVDPALGPFEVTRDLVDGEHAFVVRAVDFGGNVAEATVNFTVDTRAPLITVVGPRAPANVTRAAEVTVQVTVESDVVSVWIGGVATPLSAASASRSLAVPEGASSVLIEAEDRVGNRGNVTVYLFADRSPPSLTVELPANRTAESFVVLRGHTEAGSQVVIGNTAVPLDNGSFEILVFLAEGRNTFEVRSRDGLQNENVTAVTVTRGTLQPSHVLDLVANLAGLALLLVGAALAVLAVRRASKPDPPGGEVR